MDHPIQKILSNEFVFSPRSAFGEKDQVADLGQNQGFTPANKDGDMEEEHLKQLLIAEEHSIIDEHVQNKKRHFENKSVYYGGEDGKSGRLSHFKSHNQNHFKKNVDSFDSERNDSNPSVRQVRTEHQNKQADQKD